MIVLESSQIAKDAGSALMTALAAGPIMKIIGDVDHCGGTNCRAMIRLKT